MEKIKAYIKNPSRILCGVVKRLAPIFRDDVLYLRLLYFLNLHKRLELNDPQTFSEKMQWLKLYNRRPEYTMMVDKYAVKKYVANVIGEKYVIPTIGVWDKPKDIEWGKLPNKFVLKTTHGGGSIGVVICRNIDSFDKRKAIKNLTKSFNQNIYIESREWPYKNVKKRIIAETLLESIDPDMQDIMDYKFFCFNGVPKYCQVISERNERMSIDFYDKDWQHQEFHEPKDYPFSIKEIKPPKRYKLMLELASRLSQGHPFLRVDFYEVNECVYFGELTFFPTCGWGGFNPEEWDYKFGEWLELPTV